MNFNNMRYFISAAEHNNFTEVAKAHHVTPAAVSLQISSMEDDLGFKLFDRSKNGIALTASGRYYYEKCKEIINLYDHSVENALNIAKNKKEILRVGVVDYGGRQLLANLSKRFFAENPDAKINLIQDTMNGLKEKLICNVIDVMFNFSFDIEKEPDIFSEILGEFPIYLLVSKEHRFAQKDSIRSIEISGETIIMLSGDYGQENLKHMIAQRHSEGYEPNLELVETVEVVKLYVEMNQGVAFMPKTISEYDSEVCKLIKVEETNDTIPFVICRKKDASARKLTDSFIQITKEHFQNLH